MMWAAKRSKPLNLRPSRVPLLSAACQMGNHDGCYKGRHPELDPTYSWCECPCHPWPEHRDWGQRFWEWLRR